ncbi:hypothetical protein NDU88_000843 [Pleurodeles waltl]|uniref:Uncharacterized protein n=1 Tax=Pleurodeles waltl TaxID=8319 RepID=A0AAV7LVW8_PLEWA|nr:hypothetical protein NDU88_000843 [Pleurodeles waltl]
MAEKPPGLPCTAAFSHSGLHLFQKYRRLSDLQRYHLLKKQTRTLQLLQLSRQFTPAAGRHLVGHSHDQGPHVQIYLHVRTLRDKTPRIVHEVHVGKGQRYPNQVLLLTNAQHLPS